MPSWLFVVAVLGFAVFALVSWYNAEEQKIRRALRKTPPSRSRDVRGGQTAKLVGRALSRGPLLESPFTQRACVYYEAIVQEYRSNGKSGTWVTVIREVKAIDFLLEDEAGRAFVPTGRMKVAAVKDVELKSGTFNDASPQLEAFLSRHGRKSTGLIFNKSLRYMEGIFEPGETLAVLGTMRWEHDPDPEEAGAMYRDAPKRLVVDPLPEGFVLASDRRDTFEDRA